MVFNTSLPPKKIKEVEEFWINSLANLSNSSSGEVAEIAKDLTHQAKINNIPSLKIAAKQLIYWKQFGIKQINVGGPMGGGKSNVAEHLQQKLSLWKLKDADEMHPESNIEKMRRGFSLNDQDRVPFLRNVKKYLRQSHTISTCSALTDGYRAFLSGQTIKAVLNYNAETAWHISRPNLGLLQVVVVKPYDVALEQLDASATGKGPPRMFRDKPHFINVSKASEAAAIEQGRSGQLKDQYDKLYFPKPPYPWEALWIDTEKFRDPFGKYSGEAMLSSILRLPIIGLSF